MKKLTYFVNGWRESKTYFMSIGRFTEEELDTMIEYREEKQRNGNIFRIEVEE